MVTVQGAELASCTSHTEQAVGSNGCGAGAIWKAPHLVAVGVGAGGASLRLAIVRSRELCEALELAPVASLADHFRIFTSNHSRPVAATINTATTDHGVDEVGSSLGVAGFASGAFIGAGGCTIGGGGGVGVVCVVVAAFVLKPLTASPRVSCPTCLNLSCSSAR